MDTITQKYHGQFRSTPQLRMCARDRERKRERERQTEGSEVSLSLRTTCREKVTYPPNLS